MRKFRPFLHNTYWKPIVYNMPIICKMCFRSCLSSLSPQRHQIQASNAIKESKQFHSQPCGAADGAPTNMHRICDGILLEKSFKKIGPLKVV